MSKLLKVLSSYNEGKLISGKPRYNECSFNFPTGRTAEN